MTTAISRFVAITLNPAVDVTLKVDPPLRWRAVHHVTGEFARPGGKGFNVARMLAAAGRPVVAAGIVGRTDAGGFSEAMRRCGAKPLLLRVDCETRRNIMVTDGRGNEIKVNRAGIVSPRISFKTVESFVKMAAHSGNVVILSGSLPAGIAQSAYADIIPALRARGKIVVLDCAGDALRTALRCDVNILKPNLNELREALNRKLDTRRSILSALRSLPGRHEAAILSDGARMCYFSGGGRVFAAKPPSIRVRETTGAGDALLGQFCADFFPDRVLTAPVMARAVAAGSAAAEGGIAADPDPGRINELARHVRISRL